MKVALKVELARWKVLCVWTVSTLLGFFLCVLTGQFVFILDLDNDPWSYLITSVAGALVGLPIGAVVGYSQRRVLPPHLEWAGGWTWTTALGWALGGSLALTMFGGIFALNQDDLGGIFARNRGDLGLVGGALLGPVGAVGIGVGQWLLLRRHIPAARLWIVATVGVWGAGAVSTGLLLTALWPLILSREPILAWLIWAIVVPYAGLPGLLTGLLWRKLVGRSTNQPTTP